MGYLGGVEQTSGIGTRDGAGKHSVGDAGDEVADAVGSGERRNGQGVGQLGRGGWETPYPSVVA